MAYLSSEVVAEILSRLPVKSVLRFRSVCKTWLNMIDDPQSVSMHLTGSKPPYPVTSLLFVPDDHDALYHAEPENKYNSNPLYLKATEINIPCSTKGVTCGNCCVDGLLRLTSTDYDGHLYTNICNPATGTSLELPAMSTVHTGEEYIVYAFSFSASTQQYKVIHTMQGLYNVLIFVLTLGRDESQVFIPTSNSWSIFASAPAVYIYGDTVATVNNSCHWLIKYDDYILTFDLGSETTGSIELPKGIRCDFMEILKHRLEIINLDRCLSLVRQCKSSVDPEVEAWIIKDHKVKESWTKLLISPRGWPYPSFLPISPVSFCRNGELLIHCNKRNLALYNVDNKEHKSLWIARFPDARPDRYQVHPYIGNLLTLNDDKLAATTWSRRVAFLMHQIS